MSLEKRFQKLFNGQVVNENRVKGSVQICDEEMVKFAVWLSVNCEKSNSKDGWWIYKSNWKTTTELLEIYKQGL